jgi:hypothetical protein
MESNSTLRGIPPGYPKIAAFISKDNDFAVFRRFRQLNTRNILYLQSELMQLETELQSIDQALASSSPDDLKSWDRFKSEESRRRLMVKVGNVLKEYSTFS